MSTTATLAGPEIDAESGPEGSGLMGLVYEELRQLAAAYLRRERVGHTLQPTALVHEAYMRLAGEAADGAWDRVQFLATAATVMRRVLVEHARTRAAAKRGGCWRRQPLDSGVAVASGDADEVLALDEALERLAAVDPRQARVVELRFFGGLTMDEVAEHIGVSKRSVEADWEMARAWLFRELASSVAA